MNNDNETIIKNLPSKSNAQSGGLTELFEVVKEQITTLLKLFPIS